MPDTDQSTGLNGKFAKSAATRPGPRADKADGESAVLEKIAEMPEADRAIGARLHAIIKANAPVLSPKVWYGMPAYAKDGKVVCFFRESHTRPARARTICGSHEICHVRLLRRGEWSN